ncbi:MAG: ATP-binding protein [Bifidobacteriaceae bacterium]|jgi:predicted AAA+ superfamily ATPase|nr:ATP-binding protein [Bifidobacteriaceae bacterium]
MMEERARRGGSMLVRERYLNRLRPLYEVGDLVKVVTGVRRAGKSVLLRQVADELRRAHPAAAVIQLNFESMDIDHLRRPRALIDHVASQLRPGQGLGYVILDEVQEVAEFERAVNSLRARGDVSVFISGSNAHLMSGDLATYLAGRYTEIRVWPLDYSESLQLRGLEPAADSGQLDDFLALGGMPGRFQLEPGSQRAYLADVFNSVVLRDVVQRSGVRDIAALETIVDFALENLGRVLSPTSVAAYLKGNGRAVAVETVYSYVRALTGALLVNRVRRYDIRGKKVMASLDKLYATDVGLLAAKRVGSGPGAGDLVENAVFAQLSARGYDVYTGKTRTGEIDFVAVKDSQPRYVQVAYLLHDPAVAAREFGAFATLRDGHPRFVISLDPLTQDRDGARHLRLAEFLLDPPPELS